MFSLMTISGASDRLTLALSGSVSADVLPEIDRLIRTRQGRVSLDLSEVTLIDRVSARFFASQMERGVELVDCPSYLKRWILREITHE
jgi:ABC-type transporter Mla MlaB component